MKCFHQWDPDGVSGPAECLWSVTEFFLSPLITVQSGSLSTAGLSGLSGPDRGLQPLLVLKPRPGCLALLRLCSSRCHVLDGSGENRRKPGGAEREIFTRPGSIKASPSDRGSAPVSSCGFSFTSRIVQPPAAAPSS